MVTASYGHYGQRTAKDRAGSYMLDPISRIRFDSVLPQKAWIKLTVQIRPGSDLGGLARFSPNGSGTEARRCARTIGPGFWQDATVPPATSFLLSDLVAFFHRQPGPYCAKPARIRLTWFWLTVCVRFWPNGSDQKASLCARIIRSASGQRFRADPYPACLPRNTSRASPFLFFIGN